MAVRALVAWAVGSRGQAVTGALAEAGYEVRALVPGESCGNRSLRDLGVEVLTCEPEDVDTFRRAVWRADIICFLLPAIPGLVGAARAAVDAAMTADVGHIIQLSSGLHDGPGRCQLARDQSGIESVLMEVHAPVTHVRSSVLLEWFFHPALNRPLCERDALRLPLGAATWSMPSATDIGRVVAAIASDRRMHVGMTYQVQGDSALNGFSWADEFARALGREVVYTPVGAAKFFSAPELARLTPYFREHLLSVSQDIIDGAHAKSEPMVEAMTGKKATGVREFVNAHLARFDIRPL